MASKWREPPKDALDTLTLTNTDLASLQSLEQLEYLPFDPIHKRTEACVRDLHTQEVFRVSKGAPHVVLRLVNDMAVTQRVEEVKVMVIHVHICTYSYSSPISSPIRMYILEPCTYTYVYIHVHIHICRTSSTWAREASGPSLWRAP
ncbi:hypothetical protein EON63_04610 [archaeon]|nr:MAG: hypothetical protein EON63_04610 [archaeon]